MFIIINISKKGIELMKGMGIYTQRDKEKKIRRQKKSAMIMRTVVHATLPKRTWTQRPIWKSQGYDYNTPPLSVRAPERAERMKGERKDRVLVTPVTGRTLEHSAQSTPVIK